VAVDARRHHAFVVNQGASSVSVLDTRSGAVMRTLAVGRLPVAVAVDVSTHHAFVLNSLAVGQAYDLWSWLPRATHVRRWLPWLPQAVSRAGTVPGSVSILDTAHL
jgi:YVTN family beta-propeller protein